MGAFASAPVDLVRVQRSGGKIWRGAVAEMQGWRVSHEDAHFMVDGAGGWSVFSVMDGHGGASVAKLGSERLPAVLKEAASAAGAANVGSSFEKAVQASFVATDVWLREQAESREAGSTVTAGGLLALKSGGYRGFLANAGDSRGLVLRRRRSRKDDGDLSGGGLVVVTATEDHKPDRPDERERIVNAGGFVSEQTAVPRLDGNLSVSRGFGDFAFKDPQAAPEGQKLSCLPEVLDLSTNDLELKKGDLLIFACDGIFDVLSNEALATMIYEGMQEQQSSSTENIDLGDVAASIVTACLTLDSKDNMTLMIVEVGVDGTEYSQTAPKRAASRTPLLVAEADDEAYGLNPLSTDEWLGLDKLKTREEEHGGGGGGGGEQVLLEPEVKRSYISFLEYCAGQYGLPLEAARALRNARQDPR